MDVAGDVRESRYKRLRHACHMNRLVSPPEAGFRRQRVRSYIDRRGSFRNRTWGFQRRPEDGELREMTNL